MIFVAGRFAPEFSPFIAGSSHDVIDPWKIFATTSGVNVKSVTPLTLNATPIGIVTIGRLNAVPPQRLFAAATSPFDALRAASEPPKSTWPPLNCCTPAPEPVALYAIVEPLHFA